MNFYYIAASLIKNYELSKGLLWFQVESLGHIILLVLLLFVQKWWSDENGSNSNWFAAKASRAHELSP